MQSYKCEQSYLQVLQPLCFIALCADYFLVNGAQGLFCLLVSVMISQCSQSGYSHLKVTQIHYHKPFSLENSDNGVLCLIKVVVLHRIKLIDLHIWFSQSWQSFKTLISTIFIDIQCDSNYIKILRILLAYLKIIIIKSYVCVAHLVKYIAQNVTPCLSILYHFSIIICLY